jgi:hypothetical protein
VMVEGVVPLRHPRGRHADGAARAAAQQHAPRRPGPRPGGRDDPWQARADRAGNDRAAERRIREQRQRMLPDGGQLHRNGAARRDRDGHGRARRRDPDRVGSTGEVARVVVRDMQMRTGDRSCLAA